MPKFMKFTAIAPLLICIAGCNSNSERRPPEPVAESNSRGIHVVDYATSDPRLEPTMRVGGVLEVRTRDGGPVMLQSQVDKQRRAAEQQRNENGANGIAPQFIESK